MEKGVILNKVIGFLRIKKGRYYTIIKYDDATGKRRTKEKATGIEVKRGNKKLAKEILAERLNEYRNAYCLETVDNIYFEEYLEQWMKQVKKEVRDSTYYTYQIQMNKHILPYFKTKHILLSDLKIRDIQRYYQHEMDEGRDVGTVKNIMPISIRLWMQL